MERPLFFSYRSYFWVSPGSVFLIIPLFFFGKIVTISTRIDTYSKEIDKLIDRYVKVYINENRKSREIERRLIIEKKNQYFEKSYLLIDMIFVGILSVVLSVLKKIANINDIHININWIYSLIFSLIDLIVYKSFLFRFIPSVEKMHREYYQKVIYKIDMELIKIYREESNDIRLDCK